MSKKGGFEILKSQKGQALVEFALCLVIFVTFTFGLVATSLWGIIGFMAQDTAHEAARKYAVIMDESKSRELVKKQLKSWNFMIEPVVDTNIQITREGDKTKAVITLVPKIKTIYIMSMPTISRTSYATVEDRFINPDKYLQ